MNQIPTNGAGLASALLTPRTNYAAASAARNEALQLGIYNAQLQEQKALETQQAAASAEQYLQTLRSLPFMGRDVQKLQAHVKQVERQVYKRLSEDYGGDFRKFWQVEGQSWMANAANQLKQSQFYQQATQNLQNIASAQEARQKGEYLVGAATPMGYQTGEQQLQDFLAGKTDSYQHYGSYKPEDDLKDLRSQYAPGGRLPWERVAATEEEKLAHLINRYGQQLGSDKYLRHHQGIPTYYKQDPITDLYKFQMEQGKYNMQRQAFGTSEALKGKQGKLLDLKIQEKQNEQNGTANGRSFVTTQLAHPSVVLRFAHDPSPPKRLPSGLDIGQLPGLAGTTLFGKADQVLTRQLGLQRTKDGWSSGRITEGFTEQNGVHGFSLKGSKFKVIEVDPALFFNPRDINPATDRLNPNGVHGYARVTVQFDNPYEAEKAGLYDPNRVWGGTSNTSLFDVSTKAGTGVYDPENRTATFFTPIGKVDPQHNRPLSDAWRKAVRGQKDANEDADIPYDNTSIF